MRAHVWKKGASVNPEESVDPEVKLEDLDAPDSMEEEDLEDLLADEVLEGFDEDDYV